MDCIQGFVVGFDTSLLMVCGVNWWILRRNKEIESFNKQFVSVIKVNAVAKNVYLKFFGVLEVIYGAVNIIGIIHNWRLLQKDMTQEKGKTSCCLSLSLFVLAVSVARLYCLYKL